jgi:hypothetical protein
MKPLALLTLAALASLASISAALDIPRTVHRATGIAKASEEAVAGKRGILWVLSDASLKPT